MDVSVLCLQGGVFMTLAMAGNNRLGGQDFNNRILKRLMAVSFHGCIYFLIFFIGHVTNDFV